uniref:EB domain-containing protein n=1 Tax=Heterorhabditis bacteriophora TaxID=37862 RepID=A0A1I7XRD1_HETBA
MSSLRGIMLKSLILLIALPYISQAFTMRRQYRRPVCEPNQSCSYDVMGMQFAFCDCPGPETRCPMNPSYTIDQRGTTYHFCAHREITVCEIGEVATTVDSIQTAIHCICPDSMELIKKDESNGSIKEFVCEEIGLRLPYGFILCLPRNRRSVLTGQWNMYRPSHPLRSTGALSSSSNIHLSGLQSPLIPFRRRLMSG